MFNNEMPLFTCNTLNKNYSSKVHASHVPLLFMRSYVSAPSNFLEDWSPTTGYCCLPTCVAGGQH